jgi:hypothetical protein
MVGLGSSGKGFDAHSGGLVLGTAFHGVSVATCVQKLVSEAVTSEDIATVISRATGIPLANLVQGEREKLLHMEDKLREGVVGQDNAIKAVSDAVRMSRAGLNSPNRCVLRRTTRRFAWCLSSRYAIVCVASVI